MADETRIEDSKFDLGNIGPAVALDTGDLPWGYGEDRVTAMVRDPDSAYLYWEITDERIARARERLGPAGAHAWYNLRVYDTTGRDFDGTNANDYFDIRVDRTDREYFLMIRRPTSTMYVEIGMKSHEGYFQPIARSGRADFPRNDPSPHTALEWMTVGTDEFVPAAAPYHSRYNGPEPPLPAREGAGYVDVWRAAYAPSMQAHGEGAQREHASWSGATVHRHRSAHIERWWHLDEWRAEWRGGLRFTRWIGPAGEHGSMSWHEGPFPVELFDPQRIAVELLGEEPVHLESDGTTFTVYGPWRVQIHSFESEPRRRVLSTWSMRWVQATTPFIERWGHVVERHRESGYEREHVIVGASERLVLSERGASERWRLGGSERLWAGASEWFAAGGSETLMIGGSQWGWAGASALLYRGASERMGASERWRMGA
ncbi:MAG: DUF4912 domain-containing protein, partial [Myxococcales bacterium]|nr:DUF4912 domain-containing protein [Myxococcales bacterium]